MNSVRQELELEVSPTLKRNSLGFTIDAGGSLYKMVYRSKEDYNGGQPLEHLKGKNYGVLRMKSFPVGEGLENVLNWITEKVDVCLSEKHKGILWILSGINMKQREKLINEKLNIVFESRSEFELITSFLKNMEQVSVSIYPTNVDNVKHAVNMKKKMLQCGHGHTMIDNDSYLHELLSTEDYDAWVSENIAHKMPVTAPSLCLIVGSLAFVSKVDKDYNIQIVDTCVSSGKILTSFAEEMFKKKDYDKFLELVMSGDSRKVDLHAGDLNVEDLPKEKVISQLGKLVTQNPEGFSEADVAAGIFNFLIYNMAKLMVLNTAIHGVDTVYVCGSTTQSPYMRNVFEKHFYEESLLSPIQGKGPLKLYFIEKPGYLTTLGAWFDNIEKEELHFSAPK